MRKIKFRAWDKIRKEMIGENDDFDGFIPAVNFDGSVWFYEPDGINSGDPEQEVFTLMQFTGLYDKNKKPIYEGDVVKLIETSRNFPNINDFEQLSYTATIQWDDEGADYNIMPVDPLRIDDLRGLGTTNQEIEVIGNIHQNPELLDKDNCNKIFEVEK